jgi:hypothetical protein
MGRRSTRTARHSMAGDRAHLQRHVDPHGPCGTVGHHSLPLTQTLRKTVTSSIDNPGLPFMPVGALPPNSLVAGGSDLVRFQRTVERDMPVLRCLGKKVGEGLPQPGLRKFLRHSAIPALGASVASSAERRRRIPLARTLPTRPYELGVTPGMDLVRSHTIVLGGIKCCRPS